MRSPRAVPSLISAMQDDSDDVRVVAARALATIGDPRAIPSLAAALGDPSRWTASNVASELIALGLDAVPTLQQIAWSGEPGEGGSHEAAVTAVRVLGDIRDPRAAPVLLQLLTGSSDLNMRARSAAALGSLGGSQVAAALRAALDDPQWQVRAQAASSLGRLGDVASVPDLARAAEDRSWWVRRNCAESLANLGEAGETALSALTASPDPYVRDRARAVLEGLALRESRPGADESTGACDTFISVLSVFFLTYFLVLDVVYASLLAISFLESGRDMRRVALGGTDALMRSPFTPPISIILTALNEEATIVESVDALRLMEYREFEIVVVDDGSTDSTLARLTEAYQLVASTEPVRAQLRCQPVRGVFVSGRLPNLVVVSKDNGGCKADASNAGINAARFPLVCVTDADAVLDKDTLSRVVRPFVERPRETIAAGGTIRAINGCRVQAGRVTRVGTPHNPLAAVQVVEYLRAFIASRTAWSRLGAFFLISGAFGVFRKDALVEVGGFDPRAIGEDMELTLRLHRHFRASGRPYRIVFVPDPVVWTEVPETLKALRSQRKRWHRGLLQCLWWNRGLVFRPSYGLIGMVALPYLWILRGGRGGGGEHRLRRHGGRVRDRQAQHLVLRPVRAARHGLRSGAVGLGAAHRPDARHARAEYRRRGLAARVHRAGELRLPADAHHLAAHGHGGGTGRAQGHVGAARAQGVRLV